MNPEWLSGFLTFIAAILLIAGLGLFSRKTKLLEKNHADVLNKVIINFTLPAFIFEVTYKSKITPELINIPILAIIVGTVCAAIAYLIGSLLKTSPRAFGALVLASMVGNTGYLGFPLTQEIFGQGEVVKAVLYDLFGTVILTFTLGVIVAMRFGENTNKSRGILDILRFPPMIAFVLALLIPQSAMPQFLHVAVSYLAKATVPLIMFSIGLVLEPGNIRQYKVLIAVVIAIKLLIAPVCGLGLIKLLGITGNSANICLLESAMPTALLASVFGLHYQLDNEFLPAAILSTTLFSLLTVPAVMLLLSI